MKRRTIWIGGVATAAVLGITGATFAANGDDAESPLTDDALRRASESALEHTGGGTVTETESDSDGAGTYEVEVTFGNGRQVDVELDADFNVISDSADGDGARDDDAGGGDD